MELLQRFIEEEKEKPFVLGETDCAPMVNRWIILRTGINPMANREYTTQKEIEDWLTESGGLLNAVTETVEKAGFSRTFDPLPGDMGVITYNKKIHVAIFTGDFWFSRDKSGCLGAVNVPFRAWRVE